MNIEVKKTFGRYLKLEEEIKYGLESLYDSTISILTSALVACLSYTVVSLSNLGNDDFKIVTFIITFFITFFTILTYSKNHFMENRKEKLKLWDNFVI